MNWTKECAWQSRLSDATYDMMPFHHKYKYIVWCYLKFLNKQGVLFEDDNKHIDFVKFNDRAGRLNILNIFVATNAQEGKDFAERHYRQECQNNDGFELPIPWKDRDASWYAIGTAGEYEVNDVFKNSRYACLLQQEGKFVYLLRDNNGKIELYAHNKDNKDFVPENLCFPSVESAQGIAEEYEVMLNHESTIKELQSL